MLATKDHKFYMNVFKMSSVYFILHVRSYTKCLLQCIGQGTVFYIHSLVLPQITKKIILLHPSSAHSNKIFVILLFTLNDCTIGMTDQ